MMFGGPQFIQMYPFQGLFRLDDTTGNMLPCSILGTFFYCDVALLIDTISCYYRVVLPDSNILLKIRKNSLFFYILGVYNIMLHKRSWHLPWPFIVDARGRRGTPTH